MSSKVHALAAAVAAAGLLAAGSAAADIAWTVNATFEDGGTLTGVIGVDYYGDLRGYDLVTSANSPFGGYEFVSAPQNISGGYSMDGKEATFFGTAYNGNLLTLFA